MGLIKRNVKRICFMCKKTLKVFIKKELHICLTRNFLVALFTV